VLEREWSVSLQKSPWLLQRAQMLHQHSIFTALFFAFLQKRFPSLLREIPEDKKQRHGSCAELQQTVQKKCAAFHAIGTEMGKLQRSIAQVPNGNVSIKIPALHLRNVLADFDAFANSHLSVTTKSSIRWSDQKAPKLGDIQPTMRYTKIDGCRWSDDRRQFGNTITTFNPGFVAWMSTERCDHTVRKNLSSKSKESFFLHRMDGEPCTSINTLLPYATIFGKESQISRNALYLRGSAWRQLAEMHGLCKEFNVTEAYPQLSAQNKQMTHLVITVTETTPWREENKDTSEDDGMAYVSYLLFPNNIANSFPNPHEVLPFTDEDRKDFEEATKESGLAIPVPEGDLAGFVIMEGRDSWKIMKIQTW
jgi:hypothetical protein